jgi:hypothetical protein
MSGVRQTYFELIAPKPFYLLKEYARFGKEVNVSLRDSATKKAFALHVGAEIDRAMCDSALLRARASRPCLRR